MGREFLNHQYLKSFWVSEYRPKHGFDESDDTSYFFFLGSGSASLVVVTSEMIQSRSLSLAGDIR